MKRKMYFPTMLLTLMMMVLAGALDVAVAEPETAPKLPALTDYDFRPGKTDPMGNPARKLLLGQKQLMAIMPYSDHFCVNMNQPSTDQLEDWFFKESHCNHGTYIYSTDTATAIAAGRVLTPLRDNVYTVSYIKSDGGYTVFLFNYNFTQETWASFSTGSCEVKLNTVDIATGDIDGVTDQNGELHEEVLIAYKGYNSQCQTDVHVSALGITDGDISLKSLNTLQLGQIHPQGFLSLTMGDYNNDGIEEIAVSWPDPNHIFQTRVLVYDRYFKQLRVKASISEGFDFEINMVDLTSGDFDGDGQDEIGAVFGHYSFDHDRQYQTTLNLYEVDLAKQKMSRKGQYGVGDNTVGWKSSFGASITSGLFKYDPDNDYSVARRQIAVARIAWNNVNQWNDLYVDIFDVDEDLKPTFKDTVQARDTTCLYTYAYKPEIIAGRFHTLGYKGEDDGSQTAMSDQIAVSYPEVKCHGGSTPIMKFNVLDVNNNTMKLTVLGNYKGICFYPGKCAGGSSQTDYAASVPIVAASAREGESYYLGNPVHITMLNMIKPLHIIQEPPKHLDYLPENGEWKIMNVSRRDDFYSSFKKGEELAITTESKRETEWDIGGSESVSAEETVKAGVPDIDEVEMTASQKEEMSYDHDSLAEQVNKHYSSASCTEEFTTSADDAVQIMGLLMDIWRYRVYGVKKEDDKKNAFYEVHLPGKENLISKGGTEMSDYYQPIHQNGNLFSYPVIDNNKIPDDLGSFYLAGSSKAVTKLMAQRETYGFSGIEEVKSMSWVDSLTHEKTVTRKSTYDQSLDFSMGFKGEASALIGGADWSVDIDVSFHNSNSWSKTSFCENEMTKTGEIILNIPAAGKNLTYDDHYSLSPLLYTTKDGALKLAYTAFMDGTAATNFWVEYYTDQPDLSLNLPMMYYWDDSDDQEKLGDWFMNQFRDQRTRMRGIFISTNDPEKEENKGKIQYLGGSPTAGETIYIQTYVYNYSLVDMDGPFVVRFSYAPFKKNQKDDEPDLTTFGDVTVPPLKAKERKEVSLKWVIPNDMGGDEPGSGKPYTIHVTLDPDNEVPNEIHELYVEDQTPSPNKTCPTGKETYSAPCGIFCASNNHGYWPWDNSFMIFCPSQGTEPLAPLELKLKSESLELGHTSRSEKYGDEVFTGVEYLLKVNIMANRGDKDFRELLFYDNGKLFSMKRSFGLNPGENDFYCNWKPQESGVHTLKVMITEAENDPVPKDNSVLLDVEVLPFDRPIHR